MNEYEIVGRLIHGRVLRILKRMLSQYTRIQLILEVQVLVKVNPSETPT